MVIVPGLYSSPEDYRVMTPKQVGKAMLTLEFVFWKKIYLTEKNTEHLDTAIFFKIKLRFPMVANDTKIFKNSNPERFEAIAKMHSLNKSLMVDRDLWEK